MDPSPHATSSWFSLVSDHARSYCASLVSNLFFGGEVCAVKLICNVCMYVRTYVVDEGEGEGEGGGDDDGELSDVRLLDNDALRPQPQAEQPPIPHDSVVRGRRDGDPRVVVRRVLDGVWIEARRPELQHWR